MSTKHRRLASSPPLGARTLDTPEELAPRSGAEGFDFEAARDSGPGLIAFFQIMEAWTATPDTAMAMLGVPRATFYKWKRTPDSARLSRDQLERISYVSGIYKALQILLPSPENADTWVSRANDSPVFGGRAPIEIMSQGQVADLYRVRQLLDAEQGW